MSQCTPSTTIILKAKKKKYIKINHQTNSSLDFSSLGKSVLRLGTINTDSGVRLTGF
jgi:hypothetical protein